MRAWSRLALGVVVAAVLTGCLATLAPVDLDDFFDPAAAERFPERNPVIVIPGFLGSRLVDAESGRVVWGEVGGGYAAPDTPEGARVIARSLRDDVPSPDVRPDGVLDHLRFRKVSLRLRPYFKILHTLSAAGYRDEDLSRRLDDDFEGQHLNSFQFDYDWRLDNAANARRLHAFIRDKTSYCRRQRQLHGQPEKAIRFDVIAHSMGGLLTRYYLRYGPQPLPEDGSLPELTWEGTRHIARVILVAPPNAGAIKPAVNLIEGVRHGPGFPFYDPLLNGTFPSGYQLLARSRDGAYVDARDPSRALEDFLDPELWERHGWGLAAPDKDTLLQWLLPDVSDHASRRQIALAYQRRMLRLADQFQRALDLPARPPAGTELFLLAGDTMPTPATLAVDPETGGVVVQGYGPGDGSVLRSSAMATPASAADPQPAIRWRNIVFIDRKHSRMALDPVFADRVVYWLLEAKRDS
ncbi:MAG: hypothetical protein AAF560_29545 [Acidobacteriota bacterium]